MIRNYLKVAIRNLARNKVYVLINTLGMGIAMACCLTAYLLIGYNLEFDDYFDKTDVRNIVKVMHHTESSTGDRDQSLLCPVVMAPQVSQDIAGIENFTRFCNGSVVMSYADNSFNEGIRFADASFFQMFPLGLSQGSRENFQDRQSIFLSQDLAKKYFGEKNPMGETVRIELNGKEYNVLVGGVFAKLPLNISFNIEALVRIENYLDAYSISPDDWDANSSSSVLFKLSDIDQRQTISKQLQKYVGLSNEKKRDSHTTSFELIPFTTRVINGEVRGSDLRLPIPYIALTIFSILGFIILLIACFNLTNTTLILTGKRLKEIGVRKVIGSRRRQIVFQFFTEMIITVLLAVVSGVVMAQFIVPQFANMWQLQYGLGDLNKFNFIMALGVLLFVAAVLAGVYPALLNSRFNPIELLKGTKNVKGTNFLTRTLLVIQFSLSVIVLIAGIAFSQNAVYQQKLSLGYDKENIFTVSVQNEQEYQRLSNSISTNPLIKSLAGALNHIGPYSAYYQAVRVDTSLFKTNIYQVGSGYFKTVGLSIVSGRDFAENNSNDYKEGVIVDENFILNHGIKDPIGAAVLYNEKTYRIVGISSNHLSGLKQESDSEHIYLLANPSVYTTMVIRTNPEDILPVLSSVEKEWKKLFPARPFESRLQEDVVYEEAGSFNTNLGKILVFITILGCLLSVSGIYALAGLNVQRRMKEIGVRRVLGASAGSIVQLLNREFAIILGLAATLGGLGGYALTNALMGSLYVQHIEVGLTTLVLCGLSIFVIGIATTSDTIFRSALKNPTETLKSD